MKIDREFDVIVYGATGYTGRLVAEFISQQYGSDAALNWAMAGRSAEKLAEVAKLIEAPMELPFVIADADDPESLAALASRTKVVISTVGPYQLYGEPLLEACVVAGTDYVDLCGEPAWMRQMIDKYEDQAKKSGARIVFSCGFDSIPFDLGVFLLQEEAKSRFGEPASRVKGRVRSMQGGFSGGTAASLKATIESVGKDPSIITLLTNPFALAPDFEGPAQPDDSKPYLDETVESWVAPFIMAAINTRNIHRSNFLLGHAYGADFEYDEMMMTGPGKAGEEMAQALTGADVLGR